MLRKIQRTIKLLKSNQDLVLISKTPLTAEIRHDRYPLLKSEKVISKEEYAKMVKL